MLAGRAFLSLSLHHHLGTTMVLSTDGDDDENWRNQRASTENGAHEPAWPVACVSWASVHLGLNRCQPRAREPLLNDGSEGAKCREHCSTNWPTIVPPGRRVGATNCASVITVITVIRELTVML